MSKSFLLYIFLGIGIVYISSCAHTNISELPPEEKSEIALLIEKGGDKRLSNEEREVALDKAYELTNNMEDSGFKVDILKKISVGYYEMSKKQIYDRIT